MRSRLLCALIFAAFAWPIQAQVGTDMLTNKSGSTLTRGTVVVVDSANASAYTTTTTAGSKTVVGVVYDESIANNAAGTILSVGNYAVSILVTGAVAKGDFLTSSTTAGRAISSGSDGDSAFAIATTVNASGNGEVEGVLLVPRGDLSASAAETISGQWSFSDRIDADAGLAVTGNITVTGTVDGRDLSTDGTTLDGLTGVPVADTTAIVKGSADATKLVRIEADNITTGTTRVLTMPDANLPLQGISGLVKGDLLVFDGTDFENIPVGANGFVLAADSGEALGIEWVSVGAPTLPVSDNTSVVEGNVDATKELRIEVDGFTTSTVRVLTPPNQDYTLPFQNLSATADPTINEDSGDGYQVGSMWVNVTNDSTFFCVDATVGAAVWNDVSQDIRSDDFTVTGEGNQILLRNATPSSFTGPMASDDLPGIVFNANASTSPDPSITINYASTNGTTYPGFVGMSSRGTTASPTIVGSGDIVAGFKGYGFDGTDWEPVGELLFGISQTPGSNDMPGSFAIYLTADGSGTQTQILYAEHTTGISWSLPVDFNSYLLSEAVAEDSTFFIVDNSDNTKKIAFDASSITTGTTRTITMPDADLPLQGISGLAKGDILVFDGTDFENLPVGTNGNVVIADSGEATGIKWGSVSAASLPVTDTTSIAEGSSDATKEVRFEVDGITTGTVRVLTMADANISLVPDSGSFQSPLPLVDSTAISKGSADATKLVRIEADGITTGTTRVWTAPDRDVNLGTLQQESFSFALSDETSALTASTTVQKVTFRMPYAFTITSVQASVRTAGTGAALLTVDVHDSGTTIFSTKITLDASEKTSTTAATAAVLSDTALAADAEVTFFIDQLDTDSAARGVKVSIIGRQ